MNGSDFNQTKQQRTTVLVVEDDPWTRTTEAALLTGEGFAVVEARNGEEGLRLASQHSPDVVLLDLALPTTSGLEVLRQIKSSTWGSDIAVVVVSAYGDLIGQSDASQTDGIVTKPFDYDDLVAQVHYAAERRVTALRAL